MTGHVIILNDDDPPMVIIKSITKKLYEMGFGAIFTGNLIYVTQNPNSNAPALVGRVGFVRELESMAGVVRVSIETNIPDQIKV